MKKDESPADVAAQNVAPPEDEGSRANAPAEPSAAMARRRRTTTSRSPRTRKKTDSALTAAPPPAPAEEPVTEAAPAAPETTTDKPARATRRRTSRKKSAEPPAESPVAADPLPALTSAVVTDVGALTVPAPSAELEEKPAPTVKTARRRRTRKKPEERAMSAPLELEAPVVLPPEGAAVEEMPAEAPVPAEALPPAEAAVETPALARRRGGRRRRKAEEETAAPVAEAPPDVPLPAVEEAVTIPPPAEQRDTGEITTEPAPVEEPIPRRRRVARKKAESVEDLRGARLVTRRGLVELHINGQPYPPVFFFGNLDGPKETRRVVSEVQRAARAGVHLHSTLVEIPCPLPPDDSVYETLDERLQTLLAADPQGYLMPRLVFVPAPGWRKQYPDEVIHYADGSTGDPSIASDRFWLEVELALAAIIQHIHRATYGERVVAYHLERGEWFHPADTGYDRSFANREEFREWLRAKYKNREAALRAAWFDGQVQFYTAEIPPLPSAPRPEIAFFEPRKERRWIDFLEYTSEITADRLIALSKVVKQASENRALVSVCYGYTFEFGHTFSGHLALGRLLAAPTIDIVAGPSSYRDRLAGGAGSAPAPVDSLAVHGKLYLSENDTKTHLAPSGDSPDDYNPRMDSRFQTEQVHLRAMGQAMAHQTAVAWMDLWGEGWLDAEDIWSRFATFTARYGEFIKHRRARSPEVVVLVDERSLLHVQRGEAFLRRLLQEQRSQIQRSGASVGFYLQSDVTARNFPTDAKLYVFLTPYRLPADQRAAIKEKLQRDGKTLVWMYAVGVCDERGQPEESAHDVIGITLRPQSWNCEVGSRFTEPRHPLTEHLHNKNLGVRERLNPSFFVDDDSPGIVSLAEYLQTGLPSVAVREMAGWRSVFCGEPTLSLDFFRSLCRYAGVHLYTPSGEDYVFAGHGWLTIHATRDGSHTLFLPEATALYDLNESRLLGEDIRECAMSLRARTTRCFFAGTPEEMRKLGLPGVERGQRGRRARPTPIEPPVAEERPIEEITTVPEETLLAEMDVAVQEFEEARAEAWAEAEEPGEKAAGEEAPDRSRRRRRRRGGRGRGRRRTASETGETAPAE